MEDQNIVNEKLTSDEPKPKTKNPKRIAAGKRAYELSQKNKAIKQRKSRTPNSLETKSEEPLQQSTSDTSKHYWVLGSISIGIALLGLYTQREALTLMIMKKTPPKPQVNKPKPDHIEAPKPVVQTIKTSNIMDME